MSKNNIFILILLLVFGAAIGWFLRSGTADNRLSSSNDDSLKSSAAPSANRTGNETSENASNKGKRAIRVTPQKEEDDALTKALAVDFKESYSKELINKRAIVQQHIDKLADALELTDAQKAGLESWADANLSNSNYITHQQLEEQLLAATLTEGQKSALNGFRTRETQTRIDAAALINLSHLYRVIEFEDNQRDDVYKILNEAIAERIAGIGNAELLQLSENIDIYHLGIKEAMDKAISNAGTLTDGASIKKIEDNYREIIDQRIETMVNRMRPVLNDMQLDQYRTELKNKVNAVSAEVMDFGNGRYYSGFSTMY